MRTCAEREERPHRSILGLSVLSLGAPVRRSLPVLVHIQTMLCDAWDTTPSCELGSSCPLFAANAERVFIFFPLQVRHHHAVLVAFKLLEATARLKISINPFSRPTGAFAVMTCSWRSRQGCTVMPSSANVPGQLSLVAERAGRTDGL
jgi:hypothetical protein